MWSVVSYGSTAHQSGFPTMACGRLIVQMFVFNASHEPKHNVAQTTELSAFWFLGRQDERGDWYGNFQPLICRDTPPQP